MEVTWRLPPGRACDVYLFCYHWRLRELHNVKRTELYLEFYHLLLILHISRTGLIEVFFFWSLKVLRVYLTRGKRGKRDISALMVSLKNQDKVPIAKISKYLLRLRTSYFSSMEQVFSSYGSIYNLFLNGPANFHLIAVQVGAVNVAVSSFNGHPCSLFWHTFGKLQKLRVNTAS